MNRHERTTRQYESTFFLYRFFYLFNTSFGQFVIQGRILNKETQEPISYIGILNSNVGTLSNVDRSFFYSHSSAGAEVTSVTLYQLFSATTLQMKVTFITRKLFEHYALC